MNLINDLDLGVIVLDRDFKITSINFWLSARTQLSDHELATLSFFELFPLADKPMIKRQFKAALSLGTTGFLGHKTIKFLVPIRAVRPFDSFFELMPQDCRVGPIRNLEGEITGVFVSIQDVSETVKYELQMVTKNRELEESNKVREQFLSNMSHELRTPLNAIIGFSDLICNHPDADSKELGQQVLSSGKYLLQIVNDILDYSKFKAGQLHLDSQTFSFDEQIESVYNFGLASAQNKGLTMGTLPAHTELQFIGDPTRLRQMLGNLVDNAIKFSESGKIDIGLEMGEEPGLIRISIEDEGIGIPEEKFELLLQNGGQSDESKTRSEGGLGIGLPLANYIAKKMGGSIHLFSKQPKGTQVVVEINLEVVKTTQTFEQKREELLNKKFRVLLTEDNIINQKLATKLLQKTGLEVMVANNGLEAFEMIQAHPTEFDFILMDLQMPVMDGITSAEKIRALGNQIPIIALTANATQDSFEHAKKAGMQSYLTKPLTLDSLTDVIHETLIP